MDEKFLDLLLTFGIEGQNRGWLRDKMDEKAYVLIKYARLGLWAEKYGVPAVKFYGTFSPQQHPEGYYEIHIAPGEGGEVRFGTRAKAALAVLPTTHTTNQAAAEGEP